VSLDGSNSTNGYDTVPVEEVCPINWSLSYWTVDFHNATGAIKVYGEHWNFTCGDQSFVTINLTVIAPDPTPGDSDYINTSSSVPITIYQIAPSTGPSIDVYTDRGGKGLLGVFPYPYGWSDAYSSRDQICTYANVTYNDSPVEYKLVEFVILDPLGAERASYTAFTNASGIATVSFRIPRQGSNAENYFGNWSIYGTVDISQVQVNDTVKFYSLISDVAINNVVCCNIFVGRGYNLNVNVTIADLGNYTETFKVTVYANASCITSRNVTMSSGTSITLALIWNTTDFDYGNYAIWAYAWPVLDETDLANNNCTGSSVLITKVADLGGGAPPQFFKCDNLVDSKDLALFLQCYRGTAPPECMYLADLGSRVNGQNKFFVCDCQVTSVDLQLFLQCYRGQGPPDP
jgi:hypothetical protein